ncbi:hypothetical protein BH10PSE6_BH10PSE6_06560 [soil metagenome]
MAADDPHNAHLIVALVAAQAPARATRNLLLNFFHALGIRGSFTISVNRQQGYAMLCGFEKDDDADLVAGAVGAKTISTYGDWKSQRAFSLNGRTSKRSR